MRRASWDPIRELETIRVDMDSLCKGLFPVAGFKAPRPQTRKKRRSRLRHTRQSTIIDRKSAIVIRVEMPGVSKEDVDITVDEDKLMVTGLIKEEKSEAKERYFLSERGYRTFERSVQIPETIDTRKITATMKNGLLDIELKKKVKDEPQKIKIDIK